MTILAGSCPTESLLQVCFKSVRSKQARIYFCKCKPNLWGETGEYKETTDQAALFAYMQTPQKCAKMTYRTKEAIICYMTTIWVTFTIENVTRCGKCLYHIVLKNDYSISQNAFTCSSLPAYLSSAEVDAKYQGTGSEPQASFRNEPIMKNKAQQY